MATNIDYAALRQQALGSGIDEEAVTVNTRALIDKVLARYSGEWTTLRELIQNAADASASKVVIKFETQPSPTVPVPLSPDPSSSLRHILLHHTLKRLLVSNDGQPFAPTDWSRLKRIAEGNPDETKIGAFGVGFYSVFADCEEPFVSSGKEAMAFYWKGNALFTRKMQLPEAQANRETCFVLDYRNTNSPMPGLLSLCQFLATSLTFVDLEQIELWLDDWNVFSLAKKAAPGFPVKIPQDVDPKTREGVMRITEVHRQTAQLDAKWMNIVGWIPSSDGADGSSISAVGKATGSAAAAAPSLRSFFSRLASGPSTSSSLARKAARQEEDATQKAISEDLTGYSQASVFLRISTADIRTSVSASFAQELERATKKPPPKVTRIAILTLSHDETQATLTSKSGVAAQKAADMFASVLPQKSGKIFIGFPTAQTTGFLAHVSAPSVIPTVERENIDLNARMIRTWNCEMLRAAGILCRIAWSSEMSEIQDKIIRSMQARGKSKINKEDISGVMDAATHLFCQFSSQESTPSSRVGQLIEEAFWTCNVNASIDVLSTRGVLPSHEVRMATEELSFVEGIPVVPEELIQGARDFMGKLKDFGLLSEITIFDIKKELEIKALDSTQLGDFLMWAGKVTLSGEVDRVSVRSLLDVALATLDDDIVGGKQGQVLVIGEIKFFINPSKIPAELPVPPVTMPFAFTKNLGRGRVEALGWEELQIVPWLRWLVENTGGRGGLTPEQDITTSPAFAAQILPVLSKQWDLLSQSSKGTITELLSTRTVIPTKLGMKKPSEAYFSSVKLFDDLPTVSGLNSVKDKLLVALGVRKTVELGVVFDRLMAAPRTSGDSAATGAKWSHVDLIRYLASIRDDIPSDDIKRLKVTPICQAETSEDQNKPSALKYKVSELFEPNDALRSLHLPILQWPGIYRASSIEGKFLSFLGLQSFPGVPELVNIMAKSAQEKNFALRDHALTYYIANHLINGYNRFDVASIQTPFLPLQDDDKGKLCRPADCFSNERAALFGFPILRRDLHSHASKFGVMPDPPMNECVNRLIKDPPRSARAAREVYSYFSGRMMEISSHLVQRLGVAHIVPILSSTATGSGPVSEKLDHVRLVPPRLCFLGDGQTYGEVFDFVDFGPEANMFLLKCGSKHEPSKAELAEMVVREPARLLSVFKTPDKYLNLLRSLAENFPLLKKDKALYKEMRHAPFLLAYKEVSAPPSKKQEKNLIDDEPDGPEEEEETGIKEWSLASPSNIIVVDDFISYSLFKDRLLAAPQEEILEQFYWNLGAPTLSSIVEEDPRIGAVTESQSPAKKLQKQIVERSRLFLHDYSTDMVKHDSRWLENNLAVRAVRSISLRRTLRYHNLSHTEARTAAITLDQRKIWTLWVTASGYDLFQVSQALVNLLLVRPKAHSTMMLEMLLGTDLLKLKARGYNVDRILRAKAVEARIAEDQRQKQLEEERKHIEEQERAWAEKEKIRQEDLAQNEQDQGVKMPGAFGSDSPEQVRGKEISNGPSTGLESESRNNRPRGLFSSFTKQLGFRDGAFSPQNLQNLLSNSGMAEGPSRGPPQQGSGLPPPYSSSDPQQQGTRPLDRQPRHPEAVTAPHQLQQNLISAIQASRAHGASNLFSRPQTNTIKETASYCDERPGQDISFFADSAHGLKIFLSNTMPDKSAFLAENSKGLNAFSSILLDCGDVFALRRDSLHIFYDESGSTIAFNRQGSLFCNYRFFEQLHLSNIQNGGPDKRAESTVYWFVVLCHELAHNLVGDHNADHSYYTESFVMHFFGRMMSKIAQVTAHGTN